MIRPPVVAGQFYPEEPERLRKDLRRLIPESPAKTRCKGIVVPHAGYMYSGHVAGAVYARVELPRRYLILCPNHTGYGPPVSIMSSGGWETPLGVAPIDGELAARIKQQSPVFEEDSLAHRHEHSLEVQIPFLQHLAGDFAFVPINVGVGDLGVLRRAAAALASAISEYPAGEILVIASSDMTHYESAESAEKKDRRAIERILALDPEGLFRVVRDLEISMCGYAPTVCMLEACRHLGAEKAELVRYAHSGDVTGDHRSVVGYAGLLIY
ncbi:MAG: AmmeMemoRadiSam system protein B [Acidobacteria bacterium]|nr:AmmeMemoRadiSam system protein B [Acidobacteriota bacterium]